VYKQNDEEVSSLDPKRERRSLVRRGDRDQNQRKTTDLLLTLIYKQIALESLI